MERKHNIEIGSSVRAFVLSGCKHSGTTQIGLSPPLLLTITWVKAVSKFGNSSFYHLSWKSSTSMFTSCSHCALICKAGTLENLPCSLYSSFLQFLTSWTFSQCLVHLPLAFSFICLTFQYELIFAYSTESEKLIAIKEQSICSLFWLKYQNTSIYTKKCWILLNGEGGWEGKLAILSLQNSQNKTQNSLDISWHGKMYMLDMISLFMRPQKCWKSLSMTLYTYWFRGLQEILAQHLQPFEYLYTVLLLNTYSRSLLLEEWLSHS